MAQFPAIVAPAVGYRVEGVADGPSTVVKCPTEADGILNGVFNVELDNDMRYYQDNYMSKPHFSFVVGDPQPVSVSIVLAGDSYKSVIRTPGGNVRLNTPKGNIKPSWWRKLVGAGPSAQDVLRSIGPNLPPLKQIVSPGLPNAILSLEEKQTIRGFKFGILYAAEGQTKEDEMFSNQASSPEFEEFLDFLGDRVLLHGWPNFRAGLDVKTGTTGSHSIYQRWNGNEIMYHVSCMLPFNHKDKQQLERKRHIGNDIVVIVFIDGDTLYRPTTISSRQVHVVLVVKAVTLPDDPGQRYYRLAVVSKDGVPEFGPPLPANGLYKKDEAFKTFFYSKLLNAEKASYAAPILGNKLTRTRTALLKDVADTFM
jgi:RAP1 GTPase activating protein 1